MDAQEHFSFRKLSPEDEASFLLCWPALRNEDDFPIFKEVGSYTELLDRLQRHEQSAVNGFVPFSIFFAFEGRDIVGRLTLRHELNEWLSKYAGHIGFFVMKPHRGKGYAKKMLRAALEKAKAQNTDNVLLTCNDDNFASIKVIESCGGVLEGEIYDPDDRVNILRYWSKI